MRDLYMTHSKHGTVFIGQMTNAQLYEAIDHVLMKPDNYGPWIMLRLEIETIIRLNDWKIRQ